MNTSEQLMRDLAARNPIRDADIRDSTGGHRRSLAHAWSDAGVDDATSSGVLARRGISPRRPRSGGLLLVAASVALVMGGTAAVMSGVTGPLVDGPAPDALTVGDRDGARDGLALLDEPADAEDRFTGELADTDPQVVPGTTRFLAQDDGVSYYAGRDDAGAVCLLVDTGTEAAAECAEPGRFGEGEGIPLLWLSSSALVSALLVPDGTGTPKPSAPLTPAGETDDEDLEAADLGFEAGDRLTPNLLARVDQPPEPGSAEAALRPGDVLSLLDRPATAEDQLPRMTAGGVEVGTAGVVPESTRRLASLGDATFYAASGTDDGVCLIIVGRDIVGRSCTPPWAFADQGLSLATSGPSGRETSAVLLPDSLAGEEVEDLPQSLFRLGEVDLSTDDRLTEHLFASTGPRSDVEMPTATVTETEPSTTTTTLTDN